MTELGRFDRDGDRVGLEFRRVLRHRPERVWRALSEADDLRHWFPCDIVGERHAGAPLSMPFWADVVANYDLAEEPVLEGELLVWDPPTLFEYRWDTEVLYWQLTPHRDDTGAGTGRGDGTVLVLRTWLVPSEDAPPAEAAAAGYHLCLDALAELLDTGTVHEPSAAFATALQVRYRLALPHKPVASDV